MLIMKALILLDAQAYQKFLCLHMPPGNCLLDTDSEDNFGLTIQSIVFWLLFTCIYIGKAAFNIFPATNYSFWIIRLTFEMAYNSS